jgi:hypothetical protein
VGVGSGESLYTRYCRVKVANSMDAVKKDVLAGAHTLGSLTRIVENRR